MLGIRRALREKIFSLDGSKFVRAFNLTNKLHWKFPIYVSWDAQRSLYFVQDHAGGVRLAFARKERVFIYSKGVYDRLARLGEVYCVTHCNLKRGDLVIDCGANIGEFSVLVSQNFGCAVIAVEPELKEFNCILENVHDAKATVNKGLWNQSGSIKFYSKNRSADSSIHESIGFDTITEIPTTTLDDLFSAHGLEHVKLLKLEAEGAEPEVLDGATRSLERIEYITADLGPERGLDQQSTAVPVCNFLFDKGFEVVSIYPKRQVYLFRNRSFP